MSIKLMLWTLVSAVALADVRVYSSRAAWLADVPPPTTIDFGVAAPVAPGAYATYATPPGVTLAGVNFSGTTAGASILIVSQSFCCATYQRGSDQLASGTTGPGIAVTLPSGTSAFGFDLFNVVSGDAGGLMQGSVDVTVAGQKYIIKTPAAPGAAFVGFVSSTPVSSFTVIPEQASSATQPSIPTAANIMKFAFSVPPSVTVAPATNQQPPTIAPASLVTIAGRGLSFNPASAAVSLVDSSGRQFDLALLSVNATQIEAVTPDALASGLATLSVTPTAEGNRLTATANVAPIAPGILTANGTGQGVASALVTTTHPDGSVTAGPAHGCLGGVANCIALPIALGDPTQQQVVVTLYGTGIRGVSSLDGVAVAIGGASANVLSAGPQGDYPWMDQVSFQLPAILAGAGTVDVLLTVDGVAANTVTLRVN